jgi:ribonuclease P protein component
MRSGLSHSDHALRPVKTVSGRFFTLQRLSSLGNETRFSCSISKKIAPRAVDRNRARRRVRAAFRLIGRSGLFVIQIKKPALLAHYTELTEELRALSERLKQ